MNTDSVHDGQIQSECTPDRITSSHSPTSRKENTTSIFSFLQKFRVKNKIFENVTSLPSSPHSVRRVRNRWESVESVISTATANSFAFIPPSQFRGGPRLLHPSTAVVPRSPRSTAPAAPEAGRDNTVFLRRKYNLLGSDVSLCPSEHDLKHKRSLKNLYRNSVGNVENLKTDDWHDSKSFSSFRRTEKPVSGLTQRPKSEYSISGEFNKIHRVYCHRPGKGRAPPPPIQNPVSKSTPRKKRKAPSPPHMETTNKDAEPKMHENKQEDGIVCNDTLKLEKGQLKANKLLPVIQSSPSSSSITSEVNIPVSPKPWYKRSSVRSNKKISSKNHEKKKSAEQLLDEWMLEAGLPRTTLFYSERKPIPQVGPVDSKRKSQISMLANISELDREAAEIVRNERRREHEMAASFDNRFYDPSPLCNKSISWNKYAQAKDTNTASKRHTGTSKDLISILNAITNVTKITVNANFFKDTNKQNHHVSVEPEKPKASCCSPVEPVADTLNKLTITELEDFDKDSKKENIKVQEEEPSKSLDEETPKPVKPFSSWVCPQCTLENPSWKFICEACNKWRPYSVNKVYGRPTPPVTSELRLDNHVQTSSVKERDEIKKISENIRKQVYDILTSGENVRSNLSRLKLNDQKKKSTPAENINNDDVEEIRKARLAFFSKNCINDLNREVGARPTNIPNKEHKYYSEEDRKKLREILIELKDSLPTPSASAGTDSEKETPIWKKDSSNQAGVNELSAKSENPPHKSPISSTVKSIPVEPIYSVPIKKINRPAKKADIKIKQEQIFKQNDIKLAERSDQNSNQEQNEVETDVRQLSTETKGNANKLTTSLMVNRLLKKLQTAIASGQHHEAANIARELARLKVNCSMTRQETPDLPFDLSIAVNNRIKVNLHIRRDAIQMIPIPLKLNSNLTINELKKKMANEYDISAEKQVWMVQGKLIEDESASLEEIGAGNSKIELYLYSSSDNGNSSSSIHNGIVLDREEEGPTTSSHTKDDRKNKKASADKINATSAAVHTPGGKIADKIKTLSVAENERKSTDSEGGRESKVGSEFEIKNINNNNTESHKVEIDATKEWKCARCTLINSADEKNCTVCGYATQLLSVHEDKIVAGPSQKVENVKTLDIDRLAYYKELVDMEKSDLITNLEKFECSICIMEYEPGEGVILKDCLHTFCKGCLAQTVQHSSDAEVKCPFRNDNYSCESVLQEREIKALVSREMYEQHLARSVKEAENKIHNTFHCKTVNCQGWCIFEDNVNEFLCPVCDKTNCLTCQVIHTGLNCKQYQEVIKQESETNADANRSRLMLLEMLEKGEAMTCPTCQVIVMKKWGCDWLRCSMCKTEICWVTRGPRWGPKGKGDTSAGCRCGVKGVKCHPRCSYCH